MGQRPNRGRLRVSKPQMPQGVEHSVIGVTYVDRSITVSKPQMLQGVEHKWIVPYPSGSTC
jgi:hypothetical protein